MQTTKTSVHGAINMLGLAKRLRARIFQASTSEVYGDPQVHPQTEDYWGHVNPIGTRSCYDEGKRCAETLFFDYYRQHKLEIKVARIFNTYGPRMHPNDGRVVSNFIVQALKNEPITIYGDGSQTRSFCYVDDLVAAFVAFMATPAEFTGPMNLGNPNEFSIIELAREDHRVDRLEIEDRAGSRCPPTIPTQRQPDIALREEASGLGAQGAARRGAGEDDRVFRDDAQAGEGQGRDGCAIVAMMENFDRGTFRNRAYGFESPIQLPADGDTAKQWQDANESWWEQRRCTMTGANHGSQRGTREYYDRERRLGLLEQNSAFRK